MKIGLSKMDYRSVKSSNIESIGYDVETKTLAVKFISGREYHYHDVDPRLHTELMAAPSIGKFFGEHIRDKHTFTRK